MAIDYAGKAIGDATLGSSENATFDQTAVGDFILATPMYRGKYELDLDDVTWPEVGGFATMIDIAESAFGDGSNFALGTSGYHVATSAALHTIAASSIKNNYRNLIGGLAFSGVDPSGPIVQMATDKSTTSTTTASVTITGTTAGNAIAAILMGRYGRTPSLDAGSPLTLAFGEQLDQAAAAGAYLLSSPGGDVDVDFDWDLSTPWGLIVFELMPAPQPFPCPALPARRIDAHQMDATPLTDRVIISAPAQRITETIVDIDLVNLNDDELAGLRHAWNDGAGQVVPFAFLVPGEAIADQVIFDQASLGIGVDTAVARRSRVRLLVVSKPGID
jgi:hypothetical protein